MEQSSDNKHLSLIPANVPDMVLIEKMKNWADYSKDVISTLFGAIITKAEESVVENTALRARLSEYARFESLIEQYRENLVSLKVHGGIQSPSDMVTKYPLSQETLDRLFLAIRNKVDNLIAAYPEWADIKETFRYKLLAAVRARFKVNKLSRSPALLSEEMLRFIESFDILKSRGLLSVALLDFRAETGVTQDEAAKVLGVTRSTYGRWENGTFPRRDIHVDAIAKLLSKKPAEIILMAPAREKRENRQAQRPQKQQIRFVAGLPAQIRKARLERSLTLNEAAQEIGVSRDIIHNWEMGKAKIRPKYLPAISSFLEAPDVPHHAVTQISLF